MEWTVVTVIVVLVGLIAAVVKPIVNLNGTITKLDTTLDIFLKRYDKDCEDNEKEHIALWKRCDEQGEEISDHETRIRVLEKDEQSKGA